MTNKTFTYKEWLDAFLLVPEKDQVEFIKQSLKSKKHLHIFGKYFFPHIIKGHYEVPECHIDLLNEITKNKDSAIIFPRGFSKSSWEKIDVIHDIVYALEPVILYVSSTLTDATFHFESIKSELENNELLRKVYGNLVPPESDIGRKWTNTHFETTNKINVVARGAGRGRGVNIKNQRPTKIVCQPKGSKVITDIKIKDISNVKVGDFVLTHKGRYREVVHFQKLKPQKIYEADVDLLPYKVKFSAGHFVYARVFGGADNQYRFTRYTEPLFIPIECLRKHSVVGFPIERKVKRPNIKYEYPIKEILQRDKKGRIKNSKTSYRVGTASLSPEECYLLGAYLGDGSVTNNGIVYYINSFDKELIEKIKRIGKTNLVYKKGSVVKVFICSMKLRQIALSWKLSQNSWKVMGRDFEYFPIEYQKQIIQGYIDTDGFKDKNGIRITSVCLPLLEQIQRILLRQNVISSIRNGVGAGEAIICGIKCKAQKKYDLKIITKTDGERYNKNKSWIDGNYLWVSLNDDPKILNNKEFVYSVKVKEDKSYCNHLLTNHNCDDIENDENIRSTDQRIKMENWLYNVVMPSVDKERGKVKMIGTVISPMALVLKFYKQYGGIFRKAIENGKSIWPNYFSLKDLNKIKEELGSRVFAQEYQNTPVSDEQSMIKPEWIENCYYDLLPNKPNIRKIIMFDPQAGESKTADYYGLSVLGYWNKDKHRYLLEIQTGRKSQVDQAALVARTWQNHKEAHIVGVEKIMTQVAVYQLLLDWKAGRIELPGVDNDNRDIPIISVEPKGKDKIARLQMHEAAFERGEIHLHSTMKNFGEKLTCFPEVEHDDDIDSLIYSISYSYKGSAKMKEINDSKLDTVVGNALSQKF